ncbi:MAG TPA: LysR substrate-binding domain-containing protein, partial [Streptosporangiaceae bacterium]
PSAVRTLLPPALVALARDHPALELRVTELDPVAVAAALRDRRLDVALRHDYDIVPAEPDPALEEVPLLDETVFLAVPAGAGEGPGPGAAGPAPRDPVAAARHADWIVASPGTLCHEVAWRTCQAAGFAPRVRHQADDFTAVLALVAAGQGVSLVPELGAAVAPPGVALLPLPARRRTAVAWRRGAGRHPAVAACIAALRVSARAYPGGLSVSPPAGP